jgi:hypothetical protein
VELLTRASPSRAEAPVITPDEVLPATLAGRFAYRAGQLGVTVVAEYEPREGDRLLQATAAIAGTGSVLLTGEATARRPLLAARRVVVRVDPATIVEHPAGLASYLGDGDALILTGASRTADVEKIIVRGIHGAEEVLVVLAPPEA